MSKIHCPFCSGTNNIIINPRVARSGEPHDRANIADLVEYQCQRKEACGKTFWIPQDAVILKNPAGHVPNFRGIFPPAGGWKPHTVYLVRVCVNANNPVFRAVLHVGSVNEGKPGGYSEIWSNTIDLIQVHECYYLEAERELCELK